VTTTRDARTGGAVAAGHPLSARAGAEVLARGGNACDALVAAVLASWVCEPTVSGACGGGFLLHRSAAGRVDLLDFFAAAPGLGLERPVQPMESFEVEFGTAVQRFHIGAGSVAVPGTAAGLGAAHRQFGSLPWAELVAPAAALARTDVVQTKAHARLNEILVPVVTLTPESRAVWAPGGHVLTEGETMRQPQLADTLDRLAEAGADDLYTGELADAVVAFSDEAGAALTARDLASYRVIRRRPVEVLFRGYRVRTNAPPSSGGLLLAYGLALHDRLPVADDPLAARAVRSLAAILREVEARRGPELARALSRSGARRLLGDPSLERGRARLLDDLRAGPQAVAGRAAPRGTSHVSVVDGAGNAVAMTSSTGCGSGVFVGSTGLHLNNMLGEEDLTGHGAPRPGERLTSMMSPTIAEGPDGSVLVAGSSGSARIRSAMHRVLGAMIEHGMEPREAVDLPRIHVTPAGLDCEYGFEAETLRELERMGEHVIAWPDRNIYFGGAQVATLRAGRFAAAGDPRRGGDAVVVQA
jgi:gamma-glutamyltranspeptidase / glutathione hydrolase